MLTAARPAGSSRAHWYDPNTKKACHEIAKKDGSGPRNTDLRDARKMGLFPSVTTVKDQVLRNVVLESWKIEQGILAALTLPRLPDEPADDFAKRVLRDMDEGRSAAADLGTRIHAGIADALDGKDVDKELRVYVDAALLVVASVCEQYQANRDGSEVVVFGEGYAGCVDLLLSTFDGFIVLDFKTTKSKPGNKIKGYDDQAIQLAAYAAAVALEHDTQNIKVGNIYISTTEPGRTELVMRDNWEDAYSAFVALFEVWKWLKGFDPCGQ